ncbi:MAG: hypothetical protein NTX63_00585 [Candidatus Peregrinibacteria bacterium]|nr:hypothetical protein [Candidatus Peregrinibacteria bacterium]
MKTVLPDTGFERTIQAHRTVLTNEMARHFRDTRPELQQLGQLGKRVALEEATARMKGKFARIKNLFDNQRAIYEEIKRILDESGTKEILDIFSGLALVPLALLASKKLQKTYLLDSHTKINYRAIAQELYVRRDQIEHVQTMIHPFSSEISLPPTKQVTLIDTGLSLPGEARAPNVNIDYEVAQSSHLPHEPRLRTEDDHLAVVLKLLQGKERNVLIIDRPHLKTAKDVIESSRNRIETVMAATRGDWQVDVHEQIQEKNLIVTRLTKV